MSAPAAPRFGSGNPAWLRIAASLAFWLVGTDGIAATLPELKRMSMEELLQQEVTLVSRRAEALSQVASAVQVISGDSIRRSAATRLPEALRLASNLHVAQVDASRWAVSARGFNSVLANKLLVMIDGRTIYSPLFAGVFWANQDVMLEDIDRIEVVSGPGATLWGANAVNGVINVRTKRASDTQGLLVTGGAGSGVNSLASARYGGAISSKLHYRVYGKFAERDGNFGVTGPTAEDWRRTQGGFRLDWDATEENSFTFKAISTRIAHRVRRLMPSPAAATCSAAGRECWRVIPSCSCRFITIGLSRTCPAPTTIGWTPTISTSSTVLRWVGITTSPGARATSASRMTLSRGGSFCCPDGCRWKE